MKNRGHLWLILWERIANKLLKQMKKMVKNRNKWLVKIQTKGSGEEKWHRQRWWGGRSVNSGGKRINAVLKSYSQWW